MKQGSMKIFDDLSQRVDTITPCIPSMIKTVQIMCKCFSDQGKMLICGNGGSAADAQHIVGEMMKQFMLSRPLTAYQKEFLKSLYPEDAQYYYDNLQTAFPTMSLLTEFPLITAYANDNKPDLIFAQQVLGYGLPGDILLAISTSGNSKNIIHACKIAKMLDMKVIGLTGCDGGELTKHCDSCIVAPSDITYIIQEYHVVIYHALCIALENEFFGKENK